MFANKGVLALVSPILSQTSALFCVLPFLFREPKRFHLLCVASCCCNVAVADPTVWYLTNVGGAVLCAMSSVSFGFVDLMVDHFKGLAARVQFHGDNWRNVSSCSLNRLAVGNLQSRIGACMSRCSMFAIQHLVQMDQIMVMVLVGSMLVGFVEQFVRGQCFFVGLCARAF